MNRKTNIPKLPHAFFRWYCKGSRYEELHGDLEEFYYERVEELGAGKARWLYLMDVIRCCQPYAWKETLGQNSNTIMLRNYCKTSLRSLMKNPLSAFINVFGLSMAIAICLLAYSFLEWEYNLDQFHENKHEVFLVTYHADREGTLQHYGWSPAPVGEMLKTDFAQVQSTCYIADRNVVVKKGDKVFYEEVRLTDPAFLEMLTFPLKWGSPASLQDVNSIILSEKMSEKYFGEENPLGKDLVIIFSQGIKKTFTVNGVAMEFPKRHAIDFDFLINFENIRTAEPGYSTANWENLLNGTLIRVDKPTDIHSVVTGLEKYRQLHNAARSDWSIESLELVQLSQLSRRSWNIRNDISFQYPSQKYVLAVLSALLLALACFNYINIAIGSATKRLKEIGLRKTIGASRSQVATQFLIENIVVTCFALIIGAMLGAYLIIPSFNTVFDMELEITFLDLSVWIYLFIILLLTGITSGLYPALYVSRFAVVNIFRGSLKFGKKNMLTKVFLGFQLILTCICLTCAVMLYQNSFYLQERSWGYNQEVAVYAHLEDYSSYVQLSAAMSQDPRVVSLAGSVHHLGKEVANAVIELPDRDYHVRELLVDAQYIETMGLNLLEGRPFEAHRESEKQHLVVNETFIKKMGLQDPLGKVFKIDSIRYQVIGLVADFHIYNFEDEIRPTIFRIADEEDLRFLSLKVNKGTTRETYQALQEQWAALFPEIPFRGGYQSEVLGAYVEEAKGGVKFIMSAAFMAIVLIGLGIYGLVSLNVAGRIREFSIKKVLGAGLKNIAISIYKGYGLLVGLGLLVGFPLSYVINSSFLDLLYRYHMPMSYFTVSVSAVVIVVVLASVVALQVRKVAQSNPVDGLKVE